MPKLITHINFAKGFRGGERQTELLISSLSKHNIKQRLLVRVGSELTKRCKNIENLEIIELSKPYIFHLNAIKGSHILHAHETKALQFAYFAHLFIGVEYIVTRRVDNTIKKNFLNAKLYKNAKTSVALSSAIVKTIERVSSEATIAIIPSAFSQTQLDEHKVLEIKKRFSRKFLIGHIGALDEKHKGQSIIIELAKRVEKSYPEIHFILVGGGADEMMLKEMAEGLSNITFEGFVNNVPDYIASLELFLFPSRNEGLGSTLLDVMNHSVPIVASSVGGIVDIIEDGKNGVLFDIADLDKLEKIVIELYKNREMRERLAQNAKKSITKYSVENMTQSYISHYEI